ncbi:MAG: carboxypeptidase-like regulatory domain-containing protein [Bacteroidota bacterium]
MRLLTSSRSSRYLVLLSLVLAFSSSAAFAQGSGTLTGRIQDSKTGESLAGANIVVVHTPMGTAADIEGKYSIHGVPVGTWTIRASLIGYTPSTREITMAADSAVVVDFRLEVQTIEGNEVVVTAQARGQQTAIEQQLGSRNIVNVVSSARIQELPDANAAESIGRLPGVSLLRSGGEATQVVIRDRHHCL